MCVVGASGAGKTTLLERLLDHFPTDRSRVGLIKHTHHELDWHPPAKDSTRYWKAGAGAVVVVDPVQIASFTRVPADPTPRSTARTAGNVSESWLQTRSLLDACSALPQSIEIALAEGWPKSLVPKLWFTDGSRATRPFDQVQEVRAIIAAEEGARRSGADVALPVYTREDVAELAARIWEWAVPVSVLREAATASRENRPAAPAS